MADAEDRERRRRLRPDLLRGPLAVPAALGLAAYGAMVVADRATGTLRADTTPITIALYLVAFVGYGLAIWNTEAGKRTNAVKAPAESLHLLWLAPVLFRVLLLTTEPTLSDDVYRFLWDGHVVSNGFNPYSYPISAAELDAVSALDEAIEPIRRLANNPDLASPYFLTTQLVFAALSIVAPSEPTVIQLVMASFDVAAALLIRRLLILANLPPHRVLFFLWHPLVIVESAHGAHFDSLMTFLALLGVLLALSGPHGGRGGLIGSPLALAAATLTRPIPLLLAPVLWWRLSWLQRLLFAATLVAATLVFAFGPGGLGLVGEPDGTGVFGSARVYGAEFRFNALPATWLEHLVGSADRLSIVVVAAMAVVLGLVWLRARSITGPDAVSIRSTLRLAVVPLAAYTLLTPVLHPWYLVVLLAFGLFLAPGPSEDRRRWLPLLPVGFFTATVVFSYLTYLDPDAYGELRWVRRLQWYPTLAMLAALLGAWIVGWGRSLAERDESVQGPTGTS